MTQQSVVKHFLTEGDRMLVARLSPLRDQGGYAVATNYGAPSRLALIAAPPISGLMPNRPCRVTRRPDRLPAARGDGSALLFQVAPGLGACPT